MYPPRRPMTPPVDRNVGRCIGGDFDVQRFIAAGGIGSVYEATQRSTGKPRAIKLMHGWLASDDKMRGRFIDEARIAGSLDSDHVVEIVSAGIDDELGVPWIAMELLRGQTLADFINNHGALSLADCCEVLTQARHGLQMAHERHLVHRDLKPDNLFVADPRRLGVPFTIKVLDFGIAKWVQDARDGNKNSQVIGTPLWMAPEQLSQVASIAPATDVWAIGLLAFWMLTGHEYWLTASDPDSTVSSMIVELVAGACATASQRIEELGAQSPFPEGFDEWFARCTQIDSLQRFPDAATCIDALEPLLRARPPHDQRAAEGSLSASVSRAVPSTRELDAAFESLAPSVIRSADFQAHAQTAALDVSSLVAGPPVLAGSAAPPTPRLTVRRLAAGEPENLLWAGTEGARRFLPLAELLSTALPVGAARRSGRQVTVGAGDAVELPARTFPDRIQAAVRHVCLVLGVYPASTLVEAGRPSEAFTIESVTPPRLGVSPALLEEVSTERLRAHAAVAVARTLPAFAVRGLLDSADALESARKAALTLARGAVSGSPLYRPLVSHLGPRRNELAEALELAEDTSAQDFWCGVELTVARLALLCSVDHEAVLHATGAVPFTESSDSVLAELRRFEQSPNFDGFWYQPSN